METLDKLLFNLQTIASVPKGKKISTVKEFISVDEDSVLQPLLRWKSGDGRDKAVQSICREVRTTITISEYAMESRHIFAEGLGVETKPAEDDCDIAVTLARPPSMRDVRVGEIKKIRSGLTEASYGIDNICETYINDSNVIAYLKPLLVEISDHVSRVNKLLVEIGEYVEPRERRRYK